MKATLDKIKKFSLSPISYVQLRNHDFIKDNYHSSSLAQALPLTEHYYHPLNPCFLFELVGAPIMEHAPIITVRDGFLSFMDFLLGHYQAIPHWNTTFIIPSSFEKLIPLHMKDYFVGYDFSQKSGQEGTEKFIFAYLSQDYLGSDINSSLNRLSIKEGDKVTLFLPQETNLEKISYNSIFVQEFLCKLSLKLKNAQIRHITTREFYHISDFSPYQLIDLALDQYQVYDNFIKFLMASRGCQNVFEAPAKKSMHSLEVSMFHQMNLYEISPDNKIFSELLLYKKQNPGKNLMNDSYFTSVLRSFMNNSPDKS